MTTIIKEILRNKQTSGDLITGRRAFLIFDNTTPVTSLEAVEALYGGLLPNYGNQWPGDNRLFAKDVTDLSLVEGNQDLWRVEWQYEGLLTEDGTPAPLPDEPDYVEFALRFGREFVDKFRVNPDIPDNGSAAAGNTTDIEGTPIDLAGTPVSRLVLKQSLVVHENYTNAAYLQKIQLWRSFVGRRNSAPFLGADPGTVLYLPTESAPAAFNVMRVSHSFSFDEDFHLVQVPDRDQNGEIKLHTVDDTLRAEKVFFDQPFPNFGQFNAISDLFNG